MSYSRYLELHHLDLVQHLGTSIHVICIMLLVQAPGFSFRGSSSPYIYLQTTSVLVAPSSNRNNNGRSSKMFRSGDLFRGGGSRGRPAGSAAAAVTDDSNASEAGIAAGITDGEHTKMIIARDLRDAQKKSSRLKTCYMHRRTHSELYLLLSLTTTAHKAGT